MEPKLEMNLNLDLTKKTSNNNNLNEDLKENNISEIPSINKIFSGAGSIIMPNVIKHIILLYYF